MANRTVTTPSEKTLQITDLPLHSPTVWLAVTLGGGIGALLRFFWIAYFPFEWSGFPWAVFTQNIVGTFLMGWLLAIFTRKRGRQRYIRAFLGTGFVSSVTTFSGITVDLAAFTSSGHWMQLLLYPTISIITGLVFAWAGLLAGRNTRKLKNGSATLKPNRKR